jgi:NADPH-dependent curcumin reductase CurA
MYEAMSPPAGPANIANLIVKRARMEGFLLLDYFDRFPEAQGALAAWLAEGGITHNEHVIDGLERTPEALNMLFTGGNTGKMIVKL